MGGDGKQKVEAPDLATPHALPLTLTILDGMHVGCAIAGGCAPGEHSRGGSSDQGRSEELAKKNDQARNLRGM